MKHPTKNEEGFVLLLSTLIISAVGVSIAVSLLLLGLGTSKTSFSQEQKHQSKAIADACAEIALEKIDNDGTYSGGENFSVGEGTCFIEAVSGSCSSECTVKTRGEVSAVKRKNKIRATSEGGGGGGGPVLDIGEGAFANLVYTVSGSGSNTITVRDDDSPSNQPANETFEIAGTDVPDIQTSANRVNVGDSVSLSGFNFNDSGSLLCNCGLNTWCVDLFWNGGGTGQACNYTGNSFTGCSFSIPASPYGRHDLTGTDQGTGTLSCSGNRTSLEQTFFVEPEITVAGTSCNTSITLNGTGFAANSTVTVTWNDADTNTTVTTNSNGGFSGLTFNLPGTGTQDINAHDADLNFADNVTNPC